MDKRELIAVVFMILVGIALPIIWQTQPSKLMAFGMTLMLLGVSYLIRERILGR